MPSPESQSYLAVGRVHPERANVNFDRIAMGLKDGGRIVIQCEASQLTVQVDVPNIDGFISAHLLAEDMAAMIVGALGFALGTGYSVEMIETVEGNGTPHVFGVRPLDDSGSPLGFDPHVPMFNRAFKLAGKDVFFRLAMLDYLRAMREARDCGMYCYRAIEGIKSSFAVTGAADAWGEMHLRLGTERDTIQSTVKAYADPVRHGNWIEAPATDGATRGRILRVTRDILARYLEHAAPAT